jgi:hypothetical protein
MAANNRNVINLPIQPPSVPIKTIVSSSSAMQTIYAPKNRTILKKTFVKKRILNLAMAKPKVNTASCQTDVKKAIINNNSTNAKNRNQKLSSNKNVEKTETSQNRAESKDSRSSLVDDPGEAKVKEEEDVRVEVE